MPKLIRARDHRNQPIVEPGRDGLTLSYFNLLRLRAGEGVTLDVPQCELLCVVLSGRADIAACAQEFKNVGRRADVWSGPADSVYCGTCPRVTVRALRDGTEVAVAGALCDQPFTPFRIPPEEVKVEEVGARDSHSRQRIFHILGENGAGRSGRLLVSELLGDDGSWSGYPPHKHDSERPPHETDFEEIHHYRYRPETGFGAQFCYGDDGGGVEPAVMMTRHGDTFLIDGGYHPAVRAPGHEGYVFTIQVGRQQRSLREFFEPAHRHLLDRVPGAGSGRESAR